MLLLAQAVAENDVLVLDVQLLNFLAGFVVPLLVALLTRLHAPSGVQAVLNLGLSAIAGALATAIGSEGHIIWQEWATGIGMTWLTSIVSYYGLYKPTQIAPKISQSTRGFGIGKAPLAN